MKTVQCVLLMVLVVLFADSQAQTNNDIKSVIDNALINAKRDAVNSKKINWDTLTKQMHTHAANAKSISDLKYSFEQLIATLNDSHAKIFNSKTNEVIAQAVKYHDTEMSPLPDSRLTTLEYKILHKDVRYLRIPSFDNHADVVKEATAMRAIIDTLSKENASKWIVDLRGCSGTNFKLLMAGLGPLLGEGLITSEIDRDEKILKMYEIHNGRLYEDQHLVAHFDYKTDLNQAQVAVLIDETTSHAGEVLALVLRGRKQAKLFGAPTSGNVSIVKEIKLHNEVTLALSAGYFQDRRGSIYKENVFPHVKVKLTTHGKRDKDELISEAMSWFHPVTEGGVQTASLKTVKDKRSLMNE
jgi:carboxyl-terminal processing protease